MRRRRLLQAMSTSPLLAARRHVTKFMRSLRARVNLARARLGAWWGGTGLSAGRGVRLYQRTVISGEGRVTLGRRTTLGYPIGGGFHSSCCELQARYPDARITLGDLVAVNNGLLIIAAESVEIGDGCLIGGGVQILDFDAHGVAPGERRTSIGRVAPVVLGKNVWVGNGAIILKGTRIGDDSIVAAGAVVAGGEFPGGVIIAGNPARVAAELSP
ncbi:MAG: acyltransferase [Synergistota bacterium]|nr:acyltransferase [Synergistota bacterium]